MKIIYYCVILLVYLTGVFSKNGWLTLTHSDDNQNILNNNINFGDNITVTCSIQENKEIYKNISKHMHIEHKEYEGQISGNKYDGYSINKTSIQMTFYQINILRNSSIFSNSSVVSCKYKSQLIGKSIQTNIISMFEYFKCVSYNWGILECRFKPKVNYENDEFKIFYFTERYPKSSCMNKTIDPNEYIFTISIYSKCCICQYLPTEEIIQYILINTNRNLRETIIFKHEEIVKLNAPTHLKIENITSFSADVYWEQPILIPIRVNNIIYKLMYKFENNSDWMELARYNFYKADNYRVTIFLPNSDTTYDIRINSKKEESEKWSNYSYYQMTTAPNKHEEF